MKVFLSRSSGVVLTFWACETLSFSRMARSRTFRYVPYGVPAPSGLVTITCDGRVPGATLEVTHWTGNKTPDPLYADTSTEMALKLAKNPKDYEEYVGATVLNNHYDTDGVCSVWACLEPNLALKYEELLIDAAEAGDFGEWSSDEGLKLDLVISEFRSSDEAQAYENILAEMPDILEDIKATGGEKYEQFWGTSFQSALSDWEDICSGRVRLRRAGNHNLVIVEEATPASRISPYALHRGMKEKGFWAGTTRVLRVNQLENSSLNKYCYEKVGHGWVARLIDRHNVPDVSNPELLIAELNSEQQGESSWSSGGPSGLVAICQNKNGIFACSDDVATLLLRLDQH